MMDRPGKPPTVTVAQTWEPAWCATRQAWFYQDRANGLSSWERPDGCDLVLPRDPPSEDALAARKRVTDLPAGWECAWDVRNKRYYYFNRTTQERVWHPPKVSPPAADGGRGGGSGASFPSVLPPAKAVPRDVGPPSGPPSSSGTPTGVPSAPKPRDRHFLSPSSRSPGQPPMSLARRVSPSPTPQVAGPNTRHRHGGGRAPVAWDAQSFLRRLGEARARGDPREIKSRLREVSEHNYDLRDCWSCPRTAYVSHSRCVAVPPAAKANMPEITFSSMTTSDAIRFLLQTDPTRKVCALNFANGVNVGGGYKNGAQAQEEDLCRCIPNLYTTLNNAKREGLYPFGPSTCNSISHPAKYSDVLWTQGLTLARGGEAEGYALLPQAQQAEVSLVHAAAPNLRFAQPPDILDTQLLYNAMQTIFCAPMMQQPQINTLILGAWGCGAFGGDPNVYSELFSKALTEDRLGSFYREVHFAIPGFGKENSNAEIFRATLRKHGIRFREV